MPLIHAHSLWFQWLAEGGLVVLVPTLWLLDQLRRTWWRAWQTGDRIRRRRLEGAAIALAAYATHSLVDTFLQAQIITPVVIIGAYIVAGDRPRPELHPVGQRRRRRLVWVAIGLLVAVQIAFIPLHRGLWLHRQALARRADGDLTGALQAERAAQSTDPWNDLYRLQEAVILGELAVTTPQPYLDQAIAAFEDALRGSATWDVGWHNLAALYAQAGRFQDAIAAEQRAIGWNQLNGGYFLKLGEYYAAAGQLTEARAAYLDALKTSPWLASSVFWTDPAHPERHAILSQAVSYSLPVDPAVALDIAVYSGQHQAALFVRARSRPPERLTPASRTVWRRCGPMAPASRPAGPATIRPGTHRMRWRRTISPRPSGCCSTRAAPTVMDFPRKRQHGRPSSSARTRSAGGGMCWHGWPSAAVRARIW